MRAYFGGVLHLPVVVVTPGVRPIFWILLYARWESIDCVHRAPKKSLSTPRLFIDFTKLLPRVLPSRACLKERVWRSSYFGDYEAFPALETRFDLSAPCKGTSLYLNLANG